MGGSGVFLVCDIRDQEDQAQCPGLGIQPPLLRDGGYSSSSSAMFESHVLIHGLDMTLST